MIKIATAQLWVHDQDEGTSPAAKDVEFTETPERRPHGIDAGFRDPSGNRVRLTQVMEMSPAS